MNIESVNTVIKSCEKIAGYGALLAEYENGHEPNWDAWIDVDKESFKEYIINLIDCHKTLLDNAYKNMYS